MSEWFAKVGEDVLGPMDGAELRELVDTGKVVPSTPVRRGRDGGWAPAGKVKNLFAARRADDEEPVGAFALKEAAGAREGEVSGDPNLQWEPSKASVEVDDPRVPGYLIFLGCLSLLAIPTVILPCCAGVLPILDKKPAIGLVLVAAMLVALGGIGIAFYSLRTKVRRFLVVSLARQSTEDRKRRWVLRVRTRPLNLFDKTIAEVPVTGSSWLEVVTEGWANPFFTIQVVTPRKASTDVLEIHGNAEAIEECARAICDGLGIPYHDLAAELNDSYENLGGSELSIRGDVFAILGRGGSWSSGKKVTTSRRLNELTSVSTRI